MPIDKNSLAMFTGTEEWTRWSRLFPNMVMTDGVKYVAEHGGVNGAYWLMDAIASYQPKLLKQSASLRDMQIWTLKVANGAAVLTCQADSGLPAVVTQNIEYTDFDLDEIIIWVMPMDEKMYTLLLPSEY